jgi:hypothetical protein
MRYWELNQLTIFLIFARAFEVVNLIVNAAGAAPLFLGRPAWLTI